jgi:hypothetical protein
MSKSGNTATRWTPETPVERELVLVELSAILSSHHFRNSKRYPALLKYVVGKTLDGHSEELKERTLGVEVFDRRPDYDTNADPVVRVSAGEIRKRIAQYYHETGENSPLHIELPLGSYVPEFKPRVYPPESNQGTELGAGQESPVALNPDDTVAERRSRMFSRRYVLGALALGVVLLAFGVYSLRKAPTSPAMEGWWGPVLQSPGPLLIVLGSGHPELATPEPTETSLIDHMLGPYHHISLSSAVALSRLTSFLESRGRTHEIKEGSVTSLADLRSRSAILVGGLNNSWTLRLLEPLRFRFSQNPSHIEDTKDPQNLAWSVDFSKPFSSVSSDYAVVARYSDTTTNGTVIVIAGVGPYGTEAASEFIASPLYLEQLAKTLPRGWEKKNLEIVIKTDVIGGEAGPPSIMASTTW